MAKGVMHGYSEDGDWVTQPFEVPHREMVSLWRGMGLTPNEHTHPGECGDHCGDFGTGTPPTRGPRR